MVASPVRREVPYRGLAVISHARAKSIVARGRSQEKQDNDSLTRLPYLAC